MRDILFKAKRIDNGEWVFGNLIYSEDAEEGWEAIIIPIFNSNMFTKGGAKGNLGFENWYRVDKDTLCQYTGLTDKNGNKIWENDVVRTQKYTDKPHSKNFKEKAFVGVVTYKIYSTNSFNNPSIPNHNYKAEWEVELTEKLGKFTYRSWSKFYDCEVIGNSFDNPELLGV